MKKIHFGIMLTPEEVARFREVKKSLRAPSFSHAMRLLIEDKYASVTPGITTNVVKREALK